MEGCKPLFLDTDLKSVVAKVAKDFKDTPEIFTSCSQIWAAIHPSKLISLPATDSSSHLSIDSVSSPPSDSQPTQHHLQEDEDDDDDNSEIRVTVPEAISSIQRGLRAKDDLTTANALRIISQLARGNREVRFRWHLVGMEHAERSLMP